MSQKETYRTFIGTPCHSKEVIDLLSSLKDDLSLPADGKARFTKPENLHLTWKFLGDITESRMDRILVALQKSLTELQPINLSFQSVAFWSAPLSPKLIILEGVETGDNLKKIVTDMEKAVYNLGFPREKRPFKPHITLGRLKLKNKLDTPLSLPEKYADLSMPFQIKELCLITSTLTPQGPIYKTVGRLSLYPTGGD